MPREAGGPGAWHRTVEQYLINIPSGTSAAEFVTDAVPGYVRYLEKAYLITTTVATGSGATRLFRVLKGASTVAASGTIALADMSVLGEVAPALTVVDDDVANRFGDADTLSIDSPAADAVSFTAGAGILVLVWRSRGQQKE